MTKLTTKQIEFLANLAEGRTQPRGMAATRSSLLERGLITIDNLGWEHLTEEGRKALA